MDMRPQVEETSLNMKLSSGVMVLELFGSTILLQKGWVDSTIL